MLKFTPEIKSQSSMSCLSIAKKREEIASLLLALQEPFELEVARQSQIMMSEWEHFQNEYQETVKSERELKAALDQMRDESDNARYMIEIEQQRAAEILIRQNLQNILNNLLQSIQVANRAIRNITRGQLAQLKSYHRPHQNILQIFRALEILVKSQFLRPLQSTTRFACKNMNELVQTLCRIDLLKIDHRDISLTAEALMGINVRQGIQTDEISAQLFNWLQFQIEVYPMCQQVKQINARLEQINSSINSIQLHIQSQPIRLSQCLDKLDYVKKGIQDMQMFMTKQHLKIEYVLKSLRAHKFEQFMFAALQQIYANTINFPYLNNPNLCVVKNTLVQCQIQLLQIRGLKPIDEIFSQKQFDQICFLSGNHEYFEIITKKFNEFISQKRLQYQEKVNSLLFFQKKYQTIMQIQTEDSQMQGIYNEKIKVIEQLSVINLDLLESKIQQSNLLMIIDKLAFSKLTIDDFARYKNQKDPSKADYLILKLLSQLILGNYLSYAEFIARIKQFYDKYRKTSLLDYNFQDSQIQLTEIMKLEVKSETSKKLLKWIQKACSLQKKINSYHTQQLLCQTLKCQQDSVQTQLDQLEKTFIIHEQQQLNLKSKLPPQGYFDNAQHPKYLKDMDQIGCILIHLQSSMDNELANIDYLCLIFDLAKQERFMFNNSKIDLDELLVTLECIHHFTFEIIEVITKRIFNSAIYTTPLFPSLKIMIESKYKHTAEIRPVLAFFVEDQIQFKPIQQVINTINSQRS